LFLYEVIMYYRCLVYFFFFFSSRRRHTRWPRDWSSDVCSSDLIGHPLGGEIGQPCLVGRTVQDLTIERVDHVSLAFQARQDAVRSEERRVGKECRSRWSGEH